MTALSTLSRGETCFLQIGREGNDNQFSTVQFPDIYGARLPVDLGSVS